MSELYNNKYRIPSARLKYWDYGWNAAYFVTICTKDRLCYFGDVVDNMETRLIASLPEPEMQLSEIGQIANDRWLEIPDHFPFVELGEFQVMPNHVHGIVIINKPNEKQKYKTRNNGGGSGNTDVETRLIASLPKKSGGFAGDKNPMLNDNLSKIIRWYKGRVTFESRNIHADFEWQSRFYDHIIRDEQSFHNISEYIANNPLNWNKDDYYVKRQP